MTQNPNASRFLVIIAPTVGVRLEGVSRQIAQEYLIWADTLTEACLSVCNNTAPNSPDIVQRETHGGDGLYIPPPPDIPVARIRRGYRADILPAVAKAGFDPEAERLNIARKCGETFALNKRNPFLQPSNVIRGLDYLGTAGTATYWQGIRYFKDRVNNKWTDPEGVGRSYHHHLFMELQRISGWADFTDVPAIRAAIDGYWTGFDQVMQQELDAIQDVPNQPASAPQV